MSAVTPLFSTLSLISSILVLIPYPWYLQSRNTGAGLYMIFTSLGCLNLFINSLTWRGGTDNAAPVWCDISTKFMIAVGTALPAASLCISRRLYWNLVGASVPYSSFDVRRCALVDLAIGLSVPIYNNIALIFFKITDAHRQFTTHLLHT
ncbi:hypothetical protein H0H92_008522 [Tricholoma furcatifolium]|nr:hypothetical protein H0H92_008522 [Tricholoma furcatifolium]